MMMKKMASSIETSFVTTRTAAGAEINKRAAETLQALRGISVPSVGLVSNFDPDQRDFLTAPMRGFTMLQVGAGAATYGTLAVQGDYNPPPPASASQAVIEKFNKARVRPRLGYPALIFKAAAGGGASINTSFIRGGKREDAERFYPARLLLKASTYYTQSN